jgi:tetratricopeptide (TPR) repeat protein
MSSFSGRHNFCKLISGSINKAKKLGYSESNIENGLGNLFAEAGIFTKAESHLRKARSLDPNSRSKIWNLASILIDFDINVDEGMELVSGVLDSVPNSRSFLLLKGIGKYKQGKYEESVDILSNFWSSGIGSYTNFYHYLIEAKQALANQKKN